MAIAMVFPGQGSQVVGMLAELAQKHTIVASLFTQASDCLNFDLWSLVQNGPKDKLDRTENTQPALLVCGV
ncbi:MAG: malonyl CoA-ACP transacylase, partial [Gammaproteobacteria bacterium]|nr:malonyl CoA-ACP transacylase [Gammaproteobacteria bacterium]